MMRRSQITQCRRNLPGEKGGGDEQNRTSNRSGAVLPPQVNQRMAALGNALIPVRFF